MSPGNLTFYCEYRKPGLSFIRGSYPRSNGYLPVTLIFNPQTTLRGPMDPAQHSDGCESETENDSAETFQVIPNVSEYC